MSKPKKMKTFGHFQVEGQLKPRKYPTKMNSQLQKLKLCIDCCDEKLISQWTFSDCTASKIPSATSSASAVLSGYRNPKISR